MQGVRAAQNPLYTENKPSFDPDNQVLFILTQTMVEVCYVLITISIGVVILAFSFWWRSYILEHNPLIEKERGKLQFWLIFLLLWSTWWVAFSFTHRDLSPDYNPDITSTLSMATFAVCSVALFAFLLILDCFLRGEPPHIIPPYSLFWALLFNCCMTVPGLTLLAVYCKETYRETDYVDGLKVKGIVGVAIGSFVNFITLWIYVRFKYVPVTRLALQRRVDEQHERSSS